MGVLSEVFIASPEQLNEDVLAHGPTGRFPCVEGKGLFPTDVLKVWQIADASADHTLNDVLAGAISGSTGGHSIYAIPAGLVAAIASSGDEPLARIRLLWWYDSRPHRLTHSMASFQTGLTSSSSS